MKASVIFDNCSFGFLTITHLNLKLFYFVGKCCDEGKSYLTEVPDSPATKAFIEIIQSKYKDSANISSLYVYVHSVIYKSKFITIAIWAKNFNVMSEFRIQQIAMAAYRVSIDLFIMEKHSKYFSLKR